MEILNASSSGGLVYSAGSYLTIECVFVNTSKVVHVVMDDVIDREQMKKDIWLGGLLLIKVKVTIFICRYHENLQTSKPQNF